MGWWPFSKQKLKDTCSLFLALVGHLVHRTRQLEQEVQGLRQQVSELQGRLAQNSRNSHRPPASDGLSKPPPTSLRRPSRRKPGGQPGHPGQTLQRVQDPDHIRVHRLEVCPQCGSAALEQAPLLESESRQVFDLPERPLEVTEHRAEIKCCPHCHQRVKAAFPTGVNAPVQYGPRFESLMVYLNQQQLLPYQRLSQLCWDLFGVPLSAGTVVAAIEHVYAHLASFEQALVQQVPQAAAVHLDESGLRVEAALHWVHVASTTELTFYGVHAKRGLAAMEAFGIIGACRHWVVHDYWKPYFRYRACQHALCNQHLLRELKFLWEEQHQAWAQQLSRRLLAWYRRRQKQGAFTPRQYERALECYRQIVRRGRRRHPRRASGRRSPAQRKAANLLNRLQDFEKSILAFLADARVPFTNNQGEQDIRMIKVRQKISGSFRTLHGAQVFCRIRSYLSTCRKQKQGIWESIQKALLGQPFIPAVPPACS